MNKRKKEKIRVLIADFAVAHRTPDHLVVGYAADLVGRPLSIEAAEFATFVRWPPTRLQVDGWDEPSNEGSRAKRE